jgi:6-phosphogluconolactonase (cycloisomerase 2 family)
MLGGRRQSNKKTAVGFIRRRGAQLGTVATKKSKRRFAVFSVAPKLRRAAANLKATHSTPRSFAFEIQCHGNSVSRAQQKTTTETFRRDRRSGHVERLQSSFLLD